MYVAVLLAAVLSLPVLAEWTTPVPVSSVNTSYNDWIPRVSSDGLSLYFVRDSSGQDQIYEATRATPSGPFTQINEVLSSSSASGNALYPWVSSDNLRMYYEDESSSWQVKVSQRASVNAPWSQGTAVAGLPSGINSPSFSADELTVVFSNPNVGGWDIYMATRPDKNSPFGNITNLAGINTASIESGPYLSPDALTIYLNSDRNGTSQIFEAVRDSLNDPIGNVEHLSVFDTPGGASGQPCISSDGSAFYFDRASPDTAGVDIYVSYNVPEPCTLLLIGLGAVMLRRKR
jgi:Tol biopolymer transport system component